MSRDINDRLKDGDLPDDIKDLCSPVNESAKKFDEKNPRVRTVQQLLTGSMSRAFRREKPKALTTCHWKLDLLTGGIRPRMVWVFGAESSWGKTAYTLAVADENMDRGARILICSTEDPEEIYADRLLARRSKVQATHVRDRCLTPEEMSKVTKVVQAARPDPLFIDALGVPVERLIPQIVNAIEKYRVDLVCLDYIQELKTDLKFQDERVKFREMASMFRVAIKRSNVSGMICTQLTTPEGKTEPTKQWIRECKDIGNAAEVIALGYVSEKEECNKAGDIVINAGDKVIKIDKCKDGQRGKASMNWNEHSACFERTLKPTNEFDDFVGFEPDNDKDGKDFDDFNDD